MCVFMHVRVLCVCVCVYIYTCEQCARCVYIHVCVKGRSKQRLKWYILEKARVEQDGERGERVSAEKTLAISRTASWLAREVSGSALMISFTLERGS